MISKDLALQYEKDYHTGAIKGSFGGFDEVHWTNNDPRWEQTSHNLNRFFFSSYASHVGQELSILELGAGMCSLTPKLIRHAHESFHYNAKVVGLDISQYALEKAVDPTVSRTRACASALPFVSNCFDFVLAFDVLEHLPYATFFKDALSEIDRVLKPKSFLIVTIPLKNLDGTENILESQGIIEHYVVQPHDWWVKELDGAGFRYFSHLPYLKEDEDALNQFPFNMSPYNHYMMFVKHG